MTTYVLFNASGTNWQDFTSLQLTNSLTDNNSSSYFTALFDTPYGRHKTDFSVGQEVRIFAGSNPISYDPNLTLNYSLNETIGSIAIENVSSRNAVSSGVLINVNGNIGSAYWFNPGSNAGVSVSGIVMNNSFSIASWVYVSGLQVGQGEIFSQGTNNFPNPIDFSIAGNGTGSNTIRLALGNGGAVKIDLYAGSFSSNKWIHAAGVYDPNFGAYVYQNGSLVGSKAGSFFITNSGSITIGKRADGQYLSGALNDVRFWNTALNSVQINNVYSSNSFYNIGSSLIFLGLLERVKFMGSGLSQNLQIDGRDYSGFLQDNTISPKTYTNMEVGSIVRDIIKNNVNGITTNNVGVTSTTIPSISFNQNSVWDGLTQLAQASVYTFYVDTNKDLNFIPIGSISTGFIFDKTNTTSMNYDRTKQNMANKVYIYGARYLSAYQEIQASNFPGSVYNLKYIPFNTSVLYLGSSLIGDVFNGTVSPKSGVSYFVNQNGSSLIFVSGTATGDTRVPNGGSIVINYQRSLPIAKYGQDDTSITAFGPKTLVINDQKITDPNQASALVRQKLANTQPFTQIDIGIQGFYNLMPSQTVTTTITDFNLSGNVFPIIQAQYNFTPDRCFNDTTLTLRLNQKITDLVDQLINQKKRLDNLESINKLSTDVLTRIQVITGSAQYIGSYWEIRKNWRTGSAFTLWDKALNPPSISGGGLIAGLLSSGTGLGAGSNSFLANTGYTNYTALQVVMSGGHQY